MTCFVIVLECAATLNSTRISATPATLPCTGLLPRTNNSTAVNAGTKGFQARYHPVRECSTACAHGTALSISTVHSAKNNIRMQNEDGCKTGRACRSLQECCQLQASAMRLAALQQALHPEAGLAMSCASLPRITPLLPTLLPRAVLSAKEMCRGARSRVYEMHQIEHAVQKSVHQRAVAREPASMPPLAHAGNAPGGVARGCATWGGAGHDARSHFLPTFSITSHLLPRSLP